ncbi:MAG: amino acid synthesis family protein [Thermodesulfobacteriota bacterium]|nr:amino acid synthesis family protein [Thermodesulfobacteriota bacterium]
MEIRKYVTIVEETVIEGGKKVDPPTRKAAAIAVIKNPFAGKYVEKLDSLIDIGEALGGILGKKAVEALKIAPEKAESYGKAAIVGVDGELEHAAAILHPKLGTPLRDAVGGGKAIIPSAKKMGGPGTEIDVPLHYKDAAFVRSHFDAMSVRVQDAPRSNEIVVAIVVTDSGRPHARIGGLKKEEAKKGDGLK